MLNFLFGYVIGKLVGHSEFKIVIFVFVIGIIYS